MCENSRYLGTLVCWNNSIWYVDNDDCNFKDENDETSLFLLPEEYADADKNVELMRNGDPDSIGYWVYESLVKPIDNEGEIK